MLIEYWLGKHSSDMELIFQAVRLSDSLGYPISDVRIVIWLAHYSSDTFSYTY